MTQALNPFAVAGQQQAAAVQPVAPPQGALPVYQAPQPVAQPMAQAVPQGFGGQPQQPQRAIPKTMGDVPSGDGFTIPLFRHLAGEFDVKISKYFAAPTEMKGRCCHIVFEVLASNNSSVPVGSEWRIAYQYDFDRCERSEADKWGYEIQKLTRFVRALVGKSCRDAELHLAERHLRTAHDFAAQPGFLHLSCALTPPKPAKDRKTGADVMREYRNDLWLPTAVRA